MFGYVMANLKELEKERRNRYSAVYCGICRSIRGQCSQVCRLGLSYDMAFLSMLLMSLYEPEESGGKHACALHPLRNWTDNEYVRYGADMNVALAYYNLLDDYEDEGKLSAKLLCGVFGKELDRIQKTYPRQCEAIAEVIRALNQLEKENCPNPDLPAGCFGKLMGELLVYEEDLWADTLRQMGHSLGRFIYLMDAVIDLRGDITKNRFNPLRSHANIAEDRDTFLPILRLMIGECTDAFERLPLIQDADIMRNILYSGVWCRFYQYQSSGSKEEHNHV